MSLRRNPQRETTIIRNKEKHRTRTAGESRSLQNGESTTQPAEPTTELCVNKNGINYPATTKTTKKSPALTGVSKKQRMFWLSRRNALQSNSRIDPPSPGDSMKLGLSPPSKRRFIHAGAPRRRLAPMSGCTTVKKWYTCPHKIPTR